MSNYAIEINNLSKKYKDFALQDVSFNLEKGTILGFIGENGAGKTTTLKLIINAISKDSGTIKVLDMDNIEHEVEVKDRIGFIADEDYLPSASTLKSIKKAHQFIYSRWNEEVFMKYINMWELPLNKKVSELSKGMKTKAMFALAMGHEPEVLVMDEPTAGLDPVARIEMLDELREFVSDGEKAVIFSTHITSDLDKVADYITLIIDGKIRESTTVNEIEEKYVMITGPNDALNGREDLFIGLRKGGMTFEGLALRENLSRFEGVDAHNPNVENLLTFSIWGEKKDA